MALMGTPPRPEVGELALQSWGWGEALRGPWGSEGPGSWALRGAQDPARTVHKPERSPMHTVHRAGSSPIRTLPPPAATPPPLSGQGPRAEWDAMPTPGWSLHPWTQPRDLHAPNSVVFTYSQGCAAISTIPSRTFLSPLRETLQPLAVTAPHPLPLATRNLLSVSGFTDSGHWVGVEANDVVSDMTSCFFPP